MAGSVSRKFTRDLNGLMGDLAAGETHFVRCIKPNSEGKPRLFTPQMVPTRVK